MRRLRLRPPFGQPGVRDLPLQALLNLSHASAHGADLTGVLVVSDDAARRRAIAPMAVQAGYTVALAPLDTAASQALDLQPLAVILDLTGDEPGASAALVRQLRRGGAQALIALVGPAQDDAGCAALDAGADDFLRWPVEPRELQARLRAHLRPRSRIRPGAPPGCTDAPRSVKSE